MQARLVPTNDMGAEQLCASRQQASCVTPEAPIAIAGGVVLKFHTDGGDIRSFADNDAEVIKSRRLPRRQRCPELPASFASNLHRKRDIQGLTYSQRCECLSCVVVTLAAKML